MRWASLADVLIVLQDQIAPVRIDVDKSKSPSHLSQAEIDGSQHLRVNVRKMRSGTIRLLEAVRFPVTYCYF
jgi:hypothetical protein